MEPPCGLAEPRCGLADQLQSLSTILWHEIFPSKLLLNKDMILLLVSVSYFGRLVSPLFSEGSDRGIEDPNFLKCPFGFQLSHKIFRFQEFGTWYPRIFMISWWSLRTCNFATTEPVLKFRHALKSYGPESFESAIDDSGVSQRHIGESENEVGLTNQAFCDKCVTKGVFFWVLQVRYLKDYLELEKNKNM